MTNLSLKFKPDLANPHHSLMPEVIDDSPSESGPFQYVASGMECVWGQA